MGLAHVGKERSWNGRGHDGSSRVRLARADRAPVALGDGGVFLAPNALAPDQSVQAIDYG